MIAERKGKSMEKLRLCVPCHFGLESVLAYEIKKAGGENLTTTNGKISFDGTYKTVANANLWISSGERVLIELASFQARSFEELFEGVRAIPLEQFVAKTDAFPVKGSCIDSKLHSVPDCQKIIKKACVKRLGQKYGISYFEETGPKHQLQFNILKDTASIYLDTTGQGLHKRGYRKNSNDAPIKETLAAGIIDLARVRQDTQVCDPMCGSGTFLIESAYKAMNIACGLRRNFAAQQWEQIPQSVWQQARAQAMEQIKHDAKFHANGFDIDELAVDLTSANAKKAGVSSRIEAVQQDISKLKLQKGCTVFCNPPYGERLLDIRSAEELYKKMGQVLCPSKDNPCYIISPHEEFEKFFGKKADKKRKLYNGMIKCDLYMYFR